MPDVFVRLFVSDIDGCLSEPYRPYNLELFARLARYAAFSGSSEGWRVAPAFSVCSGRAYPYVEAVTQVLGIRKPVLFESGGGMFDPVEARVLWNPKFKGAIVEQMEEVRHWLITTCIPDTSLMYDYGKRTQAGIIGPNEEEVARLVPLIESYVAEHYPELHVFHTPVSIDIAAPGITKRQAVHWLADVTGISVGEMAFIGDTNGDIGALEEVGFPLAPANATAAVKEIARVVTRGNTTEGVVEAYEWCVAYNQKETTRRHAVE